MLSANDFKEIFPRCKEPAAWVSALQSVLPKYGIDTKLRQAAFIAQCGHESGGWSTFTENLNYSAKALETVFSKYFSKAGRNANVYAKNPEKIANVVYANRIGNGAPESGDGFRFRGRGPLQLTGRANYAAFNAAFGADIINRPELVQENKEIGLMSAVWFWNTNNLNRFADAQDIKGMTRVINGGFNGLEDRVECFAKVLSKMGQSVSTPVISAASISAASISAAHEEEPCPGTQDSSVIKRGCSGEAVKFLQTFLGLPDDGVFGKNTEIKVKEWQRANGLYPDGIVGPKTLEKMVG